MPIFTVTLRRNNTIDKKQISAAIHAASVTTGYPHNDLFQRFITLDEDSLVVDATYPDLEQPRSDNFLLIEAVLSSGSPDARKHLLLESLVHELESVGFDSNDLMILFSEIDRLNSSFGGGRRASPVAMAR